MLADERLGEAKLVSEDDRLAVLSKRLEVVAPRRMQGHHEGG